MKINLNAFTFIIPISLDSTARVNNLEYAVKFISANFDTNIIVVEYDIFPKFNKLFYEIPDNLSYIYIFDEISAFYKTKCINKAVKLCATPYFAVYDADVFFAVKGIMDATEHLKSGSCDFAYPYIGKFINIKNFSYKLPPEINISDFEILHESSVGGAIFCNKAKFIESGMMNENFKSWGFEDNELYIRLLKLNYRVFRSNGAAYHIDHPRGKNSSDRNSFYKSNYAEYNRIVSLTEQQLKSEIKSWDWIS